MIFPGLQEIGQTTAVEYDLIFNGMYTDIRDEPVAFMFTDRETKGTFCVKDIKDVQMKLSSLRKALRA